MSHDNRPLLNFSPTFIVTHHVGFVSNTNDSPLKSKTETRGTAHRSLEPRGSVDPIRSKRLFCRMTSIASSLCCPAILLSGSELLRPRGGTNVPQNFLMLLPYLILVIHLLEMENANSSWLCLAAR